MASGDWTELTNSLSTSDIDRGVTGGIARPSGGGQFVYGFHALSGNAGAAGLFTNQANFAPTAEGARIAAAIQRGKSGGPKGFSPVLFACLQGSAVEDNGYLLGLSDADPHHVVLKKGPVAELVGEDVGSGGVLAAGTVAYSPGDWLHLRLDVVVNDNGDVVLTVQQNDLTANDVTAPVWEDVPGIDQFIDDALGVNSGSQPYTSGRVGFGFYADAAARRAFIDHVEIARQT